MSQPSNNHEMQRQLASSKLASYFRFLTTLLTLAALTPWMVNQLGDARYGLWVLVISIGGYLELLDMGLMAATVKFVGGSANDPLPRRKTIVATLAQAYRLATLISLGCGSVVALLFAWFYPLPDHLRWEGVFTAIAIALRVAVQIPGGLPAGILAAHRNFDRVQWMRAGGVALTGVLQCLVLLAGGGLVELALAQTATAICETILFTSVVRRKFEEFHYGGAAIDWPMSRSLRAFSGWSMVVNVSAVIMSRTDPFLIGCALPLAAVAHYAIPMRIAEQLLTVGKQSINCVTPIYAKLCSETRLADLRREYVRSLESSLAITLAMVIPAMVLAEPLLVGWIGSDLASAAPILCWLLIAVIVRIVHENAGNLLGMTGHLRTVAFAMLAMTMLNVMLSVLLLPIAGTTGVAAATLIATLTAGLGITARLVHREYQISTFKLLRQLLSTLAPAAVAESLCLALARLFLNIDSLLEAVCVSLIAVALFGLIRRITVNTASQSKSAAAPSHSMLRRLIDLTKLNSLLSTSETADPHRVGSLQHRLRGFVSTRGPRMP